MNEKPKFLVIDGFALIFRAYYAFAKNPLQTRGGKPSSVIFGFTRMLMKLLKSYEATYWVVALDHPDKTFRHKLDHNYKANRVEAPQDLQEQIPVILDLLKAFQIKTLSIAGYEADDIIGSLCKQYKSPALQILIVTGDKDLLQLVDDDIQVLTPSQGVSTFHEYTRQGVRDKWGVFPEQIPDLFALIGDTSDNITGIPGIGPKTAAKLLQQHQSIALLYQSHNIHTLTPEKLKQKLIEHQSQVEFNYKLTKLEQGLPLHTQLTEFQNKGIQKDQAAKLLQAYECHSILKDPLFENAGTLVSAYPTHIQTTQHLSTSTTTYQLIRTQKEYRQIKSTLHKATPLSIDLESTSVDTMNAKILGLALSNTPHTGYFIPCFHGLEERGAWQQELQGSDLTQEFLFTELQQLCENKAIPKVGQNIKYDYILLKRQNITLQNIHFDTMIASHILDSTRTSHGMDFLAASILNYHTIRYQDIVSKGQTLLDIPLDKVKDYAIEDADITLQLYTHFKPLIDASSSCDLYYKIELPLLEVLADMEMCGVRIDKEYIQSMSTTITQQLTTYSQHIKALAGQDFNLNSPKQVQDILFQKLKFKTSKRTKTGYSTDTSVLEELAQEHELARCLVEHRKLHKLKTAYLDSFPQLIHPKTQRIHTSFNQTFTQTGRLSSTNPNLQNIPIKEPIGRSLRRAFRAEEGQYILSADYSQIELRILAHLSQDHKLLQAFHDDKDLHTQTAQLLFKKAPTQDVTQTERRIAKTINFSVIYGVGSLALGKSLRISTGEAKAFIASYFEEYKEVHAYITQERARAYAQGYAETLLGRRRYIKELESTHPRDRSFGERIAINTPIQGSSADIIKLAMIRIHKALTSTKLPAKMLIQIHDELVFEVEASQIETLRSLVQQEMEHAYPLSVPLKVGLSHGKNWEEAH